MISGLFEQTLPDFPPEVLQVYQIFPAALRSKDWPEISRLAKSGDIKGAKALALEHQERSKVIKAENFTARRIRIERLGLFQLQSEGERNLRLIFNGIGDTLAKKVEKRATGTGSLPSLNTEIRQSTVLLRREINKWLNGLIRKSAVLGFRNMGNALKPVFKSNRESFSGEMEEQDIVEAQLDFGLKTNFARRNKPEISLNTKKWSKIFRKVMRAVTVSNLAGLNPSQRVFELTTGTEIQLKRILANGVAIGKPSATIAREIKKFLSPQVLKNVERLGPGVYRSPFKNAMRVARTETNRAYTSASANWAKEKEWVEGLTITLSAVHSKTDICDSWAGQTVSPEQFERLVPFHPHCMCFGTIKIRKEFLED